MDDNNSSPLRVLVIGGYGEFGGRLAQLLLRDGHHVIVAGRSVTKSTTFCERFGGQAVQLDISGDLTLIDELECDVIVDAVGPFQAYGSDDSRYRIAKKALACGAHYVDLADDGNFIAGISGLDAEAKRRQRFVLSGASSTPAISGAAITQLSQQLASIEKLETTILPGSRAPQGTSVMQAILDQVGNPTPFWRSGEWAECVGWSEPVEKAIGAGIARPANLIAAADTVLFPEYFHAQTVVFRAGLAVPIMHKGLQWLGALRARGLLPNLTKFLPILRTASNAITPFGNNRGGMLVEVIGVSSAEDSTKLHHHRWILNAEPDQGPYVPAIPIRALLRNVYRIPPGARACIDELPLSEYVASMHDIGVHTQIQQETFDYLFQSALGAGWQSLTPVARRSHSFVDKRVLTGEAKIRRGDSWLTQLVASVFRFPQAIDRTPVKVTKTRMGRSEVWVRDFGGQTFHSILSAPQPQRENSGGTPIATIQEQFGVMKFTLQMPIIDNVMHMSVLNGSCLGIPIPKFLLPISNTQEFSENDTLRFSVELLAPFNLGLIVHYEGWLK